MITKASNAAKMIAGKAKMTGPAALLVLAALFLATAAMAAAPVHFKIRLPEQEGWIEMMVASGEAARARSGDTGEIFELVPAAATDRDAGIRFELYKVHGSSLAAQDRLPIETLYCKPGETVRTRLLEPPLEVHLIRGASAGKEAGAAASQPAAAVRPDLYEIELTLPQGETVMAVARVEPGELIQVENEEAGIHLAFRPLLDTLPTKAGAGTVAIEIFDMGHPAAGEETYRKLGTVPLESNFLLPAGGRLRMLDASSLDGASAGLAAEAIRGAVRHPHPTMWQSAQTARLSDNVIDLRVRMPDGVWLEGATHEGEMLRIVHDALAHEVGLAPVWSRLDAASAYLQVFRIDPVGGAGDKLELLETLTAAPELPVQVSALDGLLEVEVMPARSLPLKGTCWLGCGAGSGHGCAVGCGSNSCCTGVCCKY